MASHFLCTPKNTARHNRSKARGFLEKMDLGERLSSIMGIDGRSCDRDTRSVLWLDDAVGLCGHGLSQLFTIYRRIR